MMQLLGLVIFIAGFLLFFVFPSHEQYQKPFTRSVLLVGILLMILGIGLVVFG